MVEVFAEADGLEPVGDAVPRLLSALVPPGALRNAARVHRGRIRVVPSADRRRALGRAGRGHFVVAVADPRPRGIQGSHREAAVLHLRDEHLVRLLVRCEPIDVSHLPADAPGDDGWVVPVRLHHLEVLLLPPLPGSVVLPVGLARRLVERNEKSVLVGDVHPSRGIGRRHANAVETAPLEARESLRNAGVVGEFRRAVHCALEHEWYAVQEHLVALPGDLAESEALASRINDTSILLDGDVEDVQIGVVGRPERGVRPFLRKRRRRSAARRESNGRSAEREVAHAAFQRHLPRLDRRIRHLRAHVDSLSSRHARHDHDIFHRHSRPQFQVYGPQISHQIADRPRRFAEPRPAVGELLIVLGLADVEPYRILALLHDIRHVHVERNAPRGVY